MPFLINAFFSLAAGLALAWPLHSAYLLARHFRRGTPLPAAGIYGLYLGGFPWTLVVFVAGALHDSWKAGLGLPFFAAAALTAVWNRRMNPPRGPLATAGDFCVLGFLGLMAYTTCGGGYFDRMIQIPHAQERLKTAVGAVEDPAALTRALDDADPYVRWGAVLALRRLDAGAAPVRDALTRALASGDARVSWEAARSFSQYGGAAPSPAVLGPLLDSPDAPTRARAEKGLESLGPQEKTAALTAVARWRVENAAPRQ